jgi:uncharacterized protein
VSFRDVEVVRAIYDAMSRRTFSDVFELLHPSFVVTQDPALPWGGWYEGHHGFATFGIRLSAAIDSVVTTTALFEANGEVVQYGRTKGTVIANGATFDIPEVHRWTVTDGRAVLAHFAIDTPAMLRALNA